MLVKSRKYYTKKKSMKINLDQCGSGALTIETVERIPIDTNRLWIDY